MDRARTANVGGWLRDRAGLHPERAALIDDATGATLSYSELNELSNRVAAALSELGVGVGDRVALALASEPLYLALYFAVAKIGAVSLPLNTRLTAHELEFQLDDAEPRLVLVGGGVELPERATLSVDELRARLPEAAPEPALAPGGEAAQTILYTSGTTGVPKGAVLPHRKTVFNTLNAEEYFGLSEDDVVVVPVPLFHSYGLKILSVPALFAGATVVLVDRFDPVGLQRTVAQRGGTLLGGVPVMHRRMVRAGLEPELLASLRFAFTAGAPVDVDTIRAFDAAGVALVQGYGQTETSILCCLDPENALRKAGSVGRPVAHCQLRLAEGAEPGELLVRGDIVMSGYWRQPEPPEWHPTGDLAVIDAEGFVTLVGRCKEMYISGGENVYPAEVERVLLEHPNIADVAVVGVPDPEWGETGRAYVVPVSEPFEPDDVLAWTRERLAGYKQPRHFQVVDDLPRTPSGKVQKHRLAP